MVFLAIIVKIDRNDVPETVTSRVFLFASGLGRKKKTRPVRADRPGESGEMSNMQLSGFDDDFLIRIEAVRLGHCVRNFRHQDGQDDVSNNGMPG